MKKCLILTAVIICGTSAAFAANYDLNADYVNGANPNGAWSYGNLISTYDGSFNFTGIDSSAPWVPMTYGGTQFGFDAWWDTTSGGNSCFIFHGAQWTFPAGSTVENAWVNHAADVRWAGAAGTYNLTVTWQGGGYITPSLNNPDIEVGILSNGGTGNQATIATDNILGFTSYTYSTTITTTAGEALDFFLCDQNNTISDSRASVEATLTLVPEPSTMALLGLGGLLLWRKLR